MTDPASVEPSQSDADRAHFLRACAHMWDHAREASRRQMTHAADMILGKLGGTLLLRAESTVTKRTIPEAGYVSEGFTFADLGTRRTP
jgi:hypothetical protein